jgi:hypothetical protein
MAAQKLKVLIVELSSCVALTPRRETHGDESAMNLRGKHLREAYSPKCVEGEFSELRMNRLERLSRPTPKDFQDVVYRRFASRAADYQLPREEVSSGIFQPFG